MGVMDNMVHSESSKLSNGNDSEEKLGGVAVLRNNDHMARLKFKRRKVSAVRDFPPGCGTFSIRLRSSTEVKTHQNKNVADDGQVQSSEAKAESSAKEKEKLEQPCNDNMDDVAVTAGVEQGHVQSCNDNMDVADDGHVQSSEANVESSAKEKEKLEQPCNDNMDDVAVTAGVEPGLPPTKDESKLRMIVREDKSLLENTNDAPMVMPLDVQPIRICLPEDDGNFISASNPEKHEEVGSVGKESIVTTEQIHRRKVSVKRDFPSKTGSKSFNSEKVAVSMGNSVILENSDSRVDTSSSKAQNMSRDIVVHTGEQDDLNPELAEPLQVKRLNGTAPKPDLGAGRKKATKGIAFHAPLKLNSGKTSREYGEGSRTKHSDRTSYLSERVSPELEDSPTRQPQTLEVGIPPSRPNGSSSGDSVRNKVKETLRLFHGACRKLLQEIEAKPKKKGTRNPRVDFEASKMLKAKGKYLNTGTQIVGAVPGIDVGDEFQYRMELNILGIHRPSQGGIDYIRIGEDIYATSIVASGGYDDELDNSDVLIYTGQGGNVMKVNTKKGQEEKEPEDQKLITGNLALANSIDKKNPVRVIKGCKRSASDGDGRGGVYVYDGLYVVEKYWQEHGSHGKLVYKFKLKRIPGQPELSWKVVKKSSKSKFREGLCKLDISEGKERLPISAVNEVDDEKPPLFTYTAKMIYPDWCRPLPPRACGCTKRCSIDARNCACVAKNGGELPYNYDGALVCAKNLIHECGPHCKCPSSCYLRVTQRGIRFQLEIFKTESRGWGVRSLNSISPGSFICEYAGELLEDKEAERRTGNDEYLFDIGNKYTLAEGMKKDKEEEEDDETASGFTIDAAKKGNVGRFINHSCSPNLFAQNVLYDHEDMRIPHVMLFAIDNIPPLQELCYDYNYMVDQVRDSNGNIKKKICYCGSSQCTGRLY